MADNGMIIVYAVVCDGLGNYHTAEQAEAVRREILETPELFVKVEEWQVSKLQEEFVNYADDDDEEMEKK